jgi:hypothetical protein
MMTTATPAPTSAVPETIAGPAAVAVTVLWNRLAQPTPTTTTFDPSMVAGLPEPARRWLTHAITPGAPLHRAVVLEMEGHIHLGRWLPFRAVQLHAPPDGYVWAARTRLGPLSISGYDRYADGSGEMRWRLMGRIPVVNAAGADVDRSAAGRVALDALFVPPAWLGPAVTWQEGGDENTAVAVWEVGEYRMPVEITVAADGGLVAATIPRWGNPNGEPWGEYPCGGTVEGEADYGGIKIPTRIRAGWFFGTDRWGQGEFFRAAITNATFV